MIGSNLPPPQNIYQARTNEPDFPCETYTAASLPTQPIAWAVATFFVMFIGGVIVKYVLWKNSSDIILAVVLVFSVLGGFAVSFWPRPRYLKKILLTSSSVTGIDTRGRTIEIPLPDINLIAAECTYAFHIFSLNRWGRLHIQTNNQRVAIQLHRNAAPACYQNIIHLCPTALGLSGNGEMDVPVLQNIRDIHSWAQHIKKNVQTELRRQIIRYLGYSFLCCSIVVALGIGYLTNIGAAKVGHMLYAAAFCSVGGISFFIIAWQRIKFQHRVLADLERFNNQLP